MRFCGLASEWLCAMLERLEEQESVSPSVHAEEIFPMKLIGGYVRRIVVLGALGVAALLPWRALAQDFPVVGSQNTVTADPPVAHPDEKPCVVQLYSGVPFANFTPKTYQYAPPAGCPGPWDKVIFTADFNVSAGVQFDRTAEVFLGHVNIYYGTTAEPGSTLSPAWHVERDVTDYSALFESVQAGEVDLGNLVNSTFTGVITGSATLDFYPSKRRRSGDDREDDASRRADAVYALPNTAGGAATLNTTASQLAETFTLPTNVERAYLDVIT